MKPGDSVPRALRAWFVIHFAADMLFAYWRRQLAHRVPNTPQGELA